MKVALSTRVLKCHLNGIYYWQICKKRKTNNKDAEDVL